MYTLDSVVRFTVRGTVYTGTIQEVAEISWWWKEDEQTRRRRDVSYVIELEDGRVFNVGEDVISDVS